MAVWYDALTDKVFISKGHMELGRMDIMANEKELNPENIEMELLDGIEHVLFLHQEDCISAELQETTDEWYLNCFDSKEHYLNVFES